MRVLVGLAVLVPMMVLAKWYWEQGLARQSTVFAHNACQQMLRTSRGCSVWSSLPDPDRRDAWGNEMSCHQGKGENLYVVSLGSDGKEGGEGLAADIKCWPYSTEACVCVVRPDRMASDQPVMHRRNFLNEIPSAATSNPR